MTRVRIPPVPTDSPSPSRRPRPRPSPRAGQRLHRLVLRAYSILQRRLGAVHLSPQSLANWARPDPGLGRTGAGGSRAPYRACAASRAHPEKRPRPRVERTLPPQRPPTPNCLPISPTPRRTATASRHSPLPARPPPRRSSASDPPLRLRPQPTCPP